jgi:DNA-binding transcriptional LysR family regulator
MRGELGNFARGLKGCVKLLSNTIAATEFLPKALAAFLAAHPNIDIELEERNSTEIVSAVSEGYADAGVLIDSGDCGDLQIFDFITDRLVLITQRGSSIFGGRRIAFREALGQEFVGLTAGRALQNFLSHHAARAGQPLKVRVRLTSFDAICQMVELGVGIAVVPETAARRYRRGAIQVIGLTDEWAIRKLSICCRQYIELSEHAKRLIDHLRASDRASPF